MYSLHTAKQQSDWSKIMWVNGSAEDDSVIIALQPLSMSICESNVSRNKLMKAKFENNEIS